MEHYPLIQLIVAWTLAGAIVFTVVITCFSLVGWIKFADPKQQNKLFYCLILELVTGSVGLFFDAIRLDPRKAEAVVASIARDADAKALAGSIGSVRLAVDGLRASAAANDVRAAAILQRLDAFGDQILANNRQELAYEYNGYTRELNASDLAPIVDRRSGFATFMSYVTVLATSHDAIERALGETTVDFNGDAISVPQRNALASELVSRQQQLNDIAKQIGSAQVVSEAISYSIELLREATAPLTLSYGRAFVLDRSVEARERNQELASLLLTSPWAFRDIIRIDRVDLGSKVGWTATFLRE